MSDQSNRPARPLIGFTTGEQRAADHAGTDQPGLDVSDAQRLGEPVFTDAHR